MAVAKKRMAVAKKQSIREQLRLDELAKRDKQRQETKFDKAPDVTLSQTNKIIVPEHMRPDVLMATVKRYVDAQQKMVSVNDAIDGFPIDAAYALQKAVYEEFGFTDLRATPGFFGDTPPTFMAIPKNHAGETVDVYIGRMGLPGFENAWIQTYADDENMRLTISGSVKQKDMPLLRQLFQTARDILDRESLYRGEAVRLDSKKIVTDAGGKEILVPAFWDIDADKPLVLNYDQQKVVEAKIWTPIEQLDRCRRMGLSVKRGALILGDYGLGKSLLLYKTAQMAVANGLTVVYLTDVKKLSQAFAFVSRHYTPCVIFCEDVERAFTTKEDIKALQITLDGLESKSKDIFTVLTTNFPGEIPPGIIRPGRIDTRIEIQLPDSDAAARLVMLYAGSRLEHGTNMESVGNVVRGNSPAVIREIVESATLYAMTRQKDVENDDDIKINEDDIMRSAMQMTEHVAAMGTHLAQPQSAVSELGFNIGLGAGAAATRVLQEAVKQGAKALVDGSAY